MKFGTWKISGARESVSAHMAAAPTYPLPPSDYDWQGSVYATDDRFTYGGVIHCKTQNRVLFKWCKNREDCRWNAPIGGETWPRSCIYCSMKNYHIGPVNP